MVQEVAEGMDSALALDQRLDLRLYVADDINDLVLTVTLVLHGVPELIRIALQGLEPGLRRTVPEAFAKSTIHESDKLFTRMDDFLTFRMRGSSRACIGSFREKGYAFHAMKKGRLLCKWCKVRIGLLFRPDPGRDFSTYLLSTADFARF